MAVSRLKSPPVNSITFISLLPFNGNIVSGIYVLPIFSFLVTKNSLDKRLNISEENVDRVLSIFGNSGISAELPNSDFVQQFIAEMVENGFNDNEINSLLNTLESSARTQNEMYDLMREQLQMLE